MFKSDYGDNWTWLNRGGIWHPWSDELQIDPTDSNRVWYVADVPYIHRSLNRGKDWELLNHPYEAGQFNFGSVYALAQGKYRQEIYAANNGFGLFKGSRNRDGWDWCFFNLSGVDYTYSLAVREDNPDIIFSGYNRKPFETGAKVQAIYDGGENWITCLEEEGAGAFTSVVIDRKKQDNIYAASVGGKGAKIGGPPGLCCLGKRCLSHQ